MRMLKMGVHLKHGGNGNFWKKCKHFPTLKAAVLCTFSKICLANNGAWPKFDDENVADAENGFALEKCR